MSSYGISPPVCVPTKGPRDREGNGKRRVGCAGIVTRALSANNLDLPGQYTKVIEEMEPKYLGYQVAERWFQYPWIIDILAKQATKRPPLKQLFSDIINEEIDPREVFSLCGMMRAPVG